MIYYYIDFVSHLEYYLFKTAISATLENPAKEGASSVLHLATMSMMLLMVIITQTLLGRKSSWTWEDLWRFAADKKAAEKALRQSSSIDTSHVTPDGSSNSRKIVSPKNLFPASGSSNWGVAIFV